LFSLQRARVSLDESGSQQQTTATEFSRDGSFAKMTIYDWLYLSNNPTNPYINQ
jgi:hypothetical protein